MNSNFRELRLAAGYESQAALNRKLRVNKITLSDWDRGAAKPRWRHIPRLAALLNSTPTHLVKTLWHEEVGSSCPCGCGNKKALPNYDGAQHLYVERICVDCGNKKVFRRPTIKGRRHLSVCQRCRFKNLTQVRSISFKSHWRARALQSSSLSSFRKLRLEADFLPSEIAKTLNVPVSTVKFWDQRGYRPQWRYMPGLAQLFRIETPELVKLIWREIVGDHCDCCGGEKIFPDRPRAIHLPVKRTCRCGASRIYRSNQDRRGCNRCGLGDKLIPR